jgi:adenylylsulfate kinase
VTSRPGGVVWFTGLSGAGKTTIAGQVAERLRGIRSVELLDGDEVRKTLSQELGFSREHRRINVARISYVARLLAKHGVLAIVAAISPYRSDREEAAQLCRKDGLSFVEVFVDAALDVVIARDVKGLYGRAITGELDQLTGISDPYEAPLHPDLRLPSDQLTPEACTERVLALLNERALVC